MTGLYVQYGCGLSAPAGWINFDASPTLRFERIPLLGRIYTKNSSRFPANARYGDILKGLPIEAGSCCGIYCSHVLEHLAFDDARKALRNTFGYLKDNGTFRLVVPDLEQLAREYLRSSSPTAAHRFMESSGLGRKSRPRQVVRILKQWLGNSDHLWMWDEKAMTEILEEAGFASVRRCQFGDAVDPRFSEVEDPARFEGCLAMECRK